MDTFQLEFGGSVYLPLPLPLSTAGHVQMFMTTSAFILLFDFFYSYVKMKKQKLNNKIHVTENFIDIHYVQQKNVLVHCTCS
jgi:hypothetical protein